MADYDSSLPIRSEADGTDERVHTKIVDYADPDSAGNQLEISEKKAHVRNHGSDSDGADKEVLLSQEGHVQSNGDYDATNNKRPSSQGMIASDRDASPDETTMNKRPTAVAGDDNKIALDVAISDSSGNKIGEDNPLATYIAESPADEIDEFDQTTDTASDASANHDYTVSAGKDFKSIEAPCSASGKAKFELQIETAAASGIFNTVAAKFNSTAKPNVILTYKKKVATGVKVRVKKTNLDNQPQDLYSQIQGLEI